MSIIDLPLFPAFHGSPGDRRGAGPARHGYARAGQARVTVPGGRQQASAGAPRALRGLDGPGDAVSVVLSRSGTVPSRFIGAMTGDRFTHAALALDPDLEYMFGFGRRGPANPLSGCFRRERLDDPLYERMGRLPGLVLEVPVTRAQHEAVRAQVEDFLLDGHRYRYNFAGLLHHVTGRTRENAHRFFCSEFVYHVLYQAGVCDLGIPRTRVRPQTLLSLPGHVVFDGDLLTRPSRAHTRSAERVPA